MRCVGASGAVSFNGCLDEVNGGVAAVFVDVIVFEMVAHDRGLGRIDWWIESDIRRLSPRVNQVLAVDVLVGSGM